MNNKLKAIIMAANLTAYAAFGVVANVTVIGDWSVKVDYNGKSAVVDIPAPETYSVVDEAVVLKDYNPTASGWLRGNPPAGVKTQETTAKFMLIDASMKVASAAGNDGVVYENGKDYQVTPDWGTIGRLPEGKIQPNQKVYLSYKHFKRRLDSIVLDTKGAIVFRAGKPHPATPEQPELADGEVRLANIWLDGPVKKLDGDVNIFVISEHEYPEPPPQTPCIAEKLIPRTYAKLKNGEKVRILAWGDSVTVGTFVPDPATQRWQMQFLIRLKKAFPKADIEMMTEAWGGRNTNSYFAVPAGEQHNYQETVLAKKPDLVVTEFVNDAGLDRAATYRNYGRIRDDFKAIGAEWIILTPHYTRPDWMGLTSEKNIDDDPRKYVKAVREFAAENNIALADASLRFGRLWRRGIPCSSLMMNAINHPCPFGMSIFADALMALFR